MCTLLQHEVLVAARNERSRDLCCGVSCHPSRLCSALDRCPCRGVLFNQTLHLEPHPPRVNFIIVRALFVGGVILLSSTCVRRAESIRGREEIEEVRYYTTAYLTGTRKIIVAIVRNN